MRYLKPLLIAVVFLSAVVMVAASAGPGPVFSADTQQPPLATGCDDSLSQFVYHPDRLQIIQKCVTVTGTIALRRHEPDGDWHMQLKLDPPFAPSEYLNQRNTTVQAGNLVLEPICQGTVKQPDAIAPCKAYRSAHQTVFTNLPVKGTHVTVTGAYVQDNEPNHGWREIHPVTSIKAQ